MATASFAFAELVYPDQVNSRTLKSWEWAAAKIVDQPETILNHIVATNNLPSRGVAPNVLEFTQGVGNASGQDKARAILLRAVLAGRLNPFVVKVGASVAYKIKPEVWHGATRLCCPELLALSGVFAPALNLLPSDSLGARLAGGHIFVKHDEISQLVEGNRRVSEAVLRRAMEAIVAELQAAGGQITQPEFIENMRAKTGASNSQIAQCWLTMPRNLKFKGRPSEKKKAPRESPK